MLYSIVSEEIVFQGFEELKASKEISYQGKRLLVQPLSMTRAQIVQIISTDPSDFLSPELQPGTVIEMGSLV